MTTRALLPSLEAVTMHAPKVLILDHKLVDVITIKKALARHGYEAAHLTSPSGVLAKLDYERPDVLLVNPWMPRLDVAFLIENTVHNPAFEAMVCVAIGDHDATTLETFCVEHDLHGYYSKSMDLEQIGAFLDNFFE